MWGIFEQYYAGSGRLNAEAGLMLKLRCPRCLLIKPANKVVGMSGVFNKHGSPWYLFESRAYGSPAFLVP